MAVPSLDEVLLNVVTFIELTKNTPLFDIRSKLLDLVSNNEANNILVIHSDTRYDSVENLCYRVYGPSRASVWPLYLSHRSSTHRNSINLLRDIVILFLRTATKDKRVVLIGPHVLYEVVIPILHSNNASLFKGAFLQSFDSVADFQKSVSNVVRSSFGRKRKREDDE